MAPNRPYKVHQVFQQFCSGASLGPIVFCHKNFDSSRAFLKGDCNRESGVLLPNSWLREYGKCVASVIRGAIHAMRGYCHYISLDLYSCRQLSLADVLRQNERIHV
jgi:hypothetical protein